MTAAVQKENKSIEHEVKEGEMEYKNKNTEHLKYKVPKHCEKNHGCS